MLSGCSSNLNCHSRNRWRFAIVLCILFSDAISIAEESISEKPLPEFQKIPWAKLSREKVMIEYSNLVASGGIDSNICKLDFFRLEMLKIFTPSVNDCDDLQAVFEVRLHSSLLSLCRENQQSLRYLDDVSKNCPRISACLLVQNYDLVSRLKPSKNYDVDISTNANRCIKASSRPPWMDLDFFNDIKKIYDEAEGRIQDLHKEKTRSVRLGVGISSVIIGAGLLVSAIPLAYYTETRTPLPFPSSCMSPLGVTNDPCIGDFRAYIPTLICGAAVTIGGGLFIKFGHLWIKNPSRASQSASSQGGPK